MEKNYVINNAIKLVSSEIEKLKKDRRILKAELKTVKKGTSLGNFEQAKKAERDILIGLQQKKEKLCVLHILNQRYMKEANGGKFPVKQHKAGCTCQRCQSSKFVDFVLTRQDVLNLVGALTTWLEKSKGTTHSGQTMLSLLTSKMKQ